MPSVRATLSSLWQRPAAAGATGPRVRDGVLTGVLAVLAVVEGALRTDLAWPVATTAVALASLAGLPWRRSRPLVVVAWLTSVSAGFGIARWAAGGEQNALAVMLVLVAVPYALFRWGAGRSQVVGACVLTAGLAFSLALGTEGLDGAIAGVAAIGGACLIGAMRRQRVEARARELEHARMREREALARDLHDTVAHRVSAIAIRAQVARAVGLGSRTASDGGAHAPAATAVLTESLEVIEREAQAVLEETRALVRVLRSTDGADASIARSALAAADLYGPTPGLAELEALATDGPPLVLVRVDAPGEVPALVATTLFRVAQEGVTNARRHARGATRVEVDVRARGDDVCITVGDDGAVSRPGSGRGYGLRGMRERVALLGGTFSAGFAHPGSLGGDGPAPVGGDGPAPGGWVVSASIPRRSSEATV
ncbi:sensor histidine kinase [Pseudoclavibacter endophyticus]|nr:histidine kinase [Pseudoclavibacter endophyticus]